MRKLNSVPAGEASAKFSLLLGDVACFDCRISQLPTASDVVDYFSWRNEDAHRNALNAHCYWILRKEGRKARQATADLEGLSVAAKNELLFQHGINFNDLPSWQKRGCGVYWEDYIKAGVNPLSGEEVTVERRRLKRNLDLPMKGSYSEFVCSSWRPGRSADRSDINTTHVHFCVFVFTIGHAAQSLPLHLSAKLLCARLEKPAFTKLSRAILSDMTCGLETSGMSPGSSTGYCGLFGITRIEAEVQV